MVPISMPDNNSTLIICQMRPRTRWGYRVSHDKDQRSTYSGLQEIVPTNIDDHTTNRGSCIQSQFQVSCLLENIHILVLVDGSLIDGVGTGSVDHFTSHHTQWKEKYHSKIPSEICVNNSSESGLIGK